METSTTDPNVMIGLSVFAVALVAAMVGRWALNVRDGIADRRAARESKAAAK